jgi:predicted anti-sigma-YlaC factor YlaD
MALNELTCKELVELVTDYLEGVLPPAERRRFEEHLAGCQGCRDYLQQMRETIRLTGQLTEEAIEPQAREALLHVFRAWKNSGKV